MPKVAADNSPLLERAIFGYDGTNYRVVKVDTDGNLVAAVKATQTIEVTQDTAADLLATVDVAAGQTIEVTQDTAADLLATATLAADQNVQARSHGYISGAWQKAPLPLGYSGDQSQLVSNLNASSGFNVLNGTAVPAGEIWDVQAISAYDANNALTYLQLFVTVNSVDLYLVDERPVGAAALVLWQGSLILAEGDQVRATFEGATVGDDLFLAYHAVRIDIDQ